MEEKNMTFLLITWSATEVEFFKVLKLALIKEISLVISDIRLQDSEL
jgi:hypothetical protein